MRWRKFEYSESFCDFSSCESQISTSRQTFVCWLGGDDTEIFGRVENENISQDSSGSRKVERKSWFFTRENVKTLENWKIRELFTCENEIIF